MYRRPTTDAGMEAFIRNKYEKKKFIAKVCKREFAEVFHIFKI